MMIKTASILGIIAAIVASSATGAPQESTPENTAPPAETSVAEEVKPVENIEGLSMKTDAAVYPVNTEEFKLMIDNQLGYTLDTGLDYQIERWTGTTWENLDLAFPVPLMLMIVPSGEQTEMTVRLWQSAYDYEPGQYRVVKTFGVSGQPVRIAAEFELQ